MCCEVAADGGTAIKRDISTNGVAIRSAKTRVGGADVIHIVTSDTNAGSTDYDFRREVAAVKWQQLIGTNLQVLIGQAVAGAIHHVKTNTIIVTEPVAYGEFASGTLALMPLPRWMPTLS